MCMIITDNDKRSKKSEIISVFERIPPLVCLYLEDSSMAYKESVTRLDASSFGKEQFCAS